MALARRAHQRQGGSSRAHVLSASGSESSEPRPHSSVHGRQLGQHPRLREGTVLFVRGADAVSTLSRLADGGLDATTSAVLRQRAQQRRCGLQALGT
eukprot:10618306-Heterocapsa_arctica.AAC.1